MMEKIIKLFSVALIVILVGVLVATILGRIQSCRDKPHNTPFQNVTPHIGVSANTYVTEEQIIEKAKELIRLKDPRIYKDIEQLNNATYLIRAYARKTNQADLIYNKEGKQGYVFHEIHMPDQDGKSGPAIGYVMIYDSGKVVSKVYNFEMAVNTLVSKKDERYKVINSADLYMLQAGLANRKDTVKLNWVGKPYRLEIKNAEHFINLEKAKKSKIVFDFRPDIGFNTVSTLTGEFDIIPNLGASFVSYKNDEVTRFRFLRVGVGVRDIDNGVNLSIAPVLYNLHDLVPFIHNSYIGLLLGYDNRKLDLGLGLNLTF